MRVQCLARLVVGEKHAMMHRPRLVLQYSSDVQSMLLQSPSYHPTPTSSILQPDTYDTAEYRSRRSCLKYRVVAVLLLALSTAVHHALALLSDTESPTKALGRGSPHTTNMARIYADANEHMPRTYWDYDSVNISWGVLESYEVVRKIGASCLTSCFL